MARVLQMTLKKRWFDMIKAGVKKEEYREIKAYWEARLVGQEYDAIEFVNGYSPSSPRFTIEYFGYTIGQGREEWGGIPGQNVFRLKLGSIIS